MPTYVYKAITNSGLTVKNRVDAPSRQNLIQALKNNELTPVSVTQVAYGGARAKKKKNIRDLDEIMKNASTAKIGADVNKKTATLKERLSMNITKTEKVTERDLVVFTENFYLLKKANFNNIHALRTIIDSTDNMTFRGVLEDILAGVEAGENIYTTMEYYSDIFPYIYTNMIKVGELSGSLTNSLQQAVEYLDSSEALNVKIRRILVPNIAQFIGLVVILIVSTLVAIPAIQNVYEQFGTTDKLPAITIWYQGVLNWQIKYWYVIVGIIGAIVGSIVFYINTPKGKYNFDYFKYKMPVFGELNFAIDFSRLMRAMYLNLDNGMRIQDALEVSKNVCKNYVMLSIIETSLNNIIIGESWIEPFENSGLAKPMITEMLKIGMQTDLTEMIKKLVEYMEIDIDNIMQKIIKVLPEISYAIVGVVLIFVVIVVLGPAIELYMGGWLFDAVDI